MPKKYFYIAKSLNGENKTGLMEAEDIHQLSRVLHNQGYVLISANLEEEIKKKKLVISDLVFRFVPFFGKVSLKEKIFFTRNLRIMIGAGISFSRALNILIIQSGNRNFKKILSEIEEKTLKGETLFKSLGEYPEVFSEFFCNMIKAGEESGNLENVLKILETQMENEADLNSKITGAMIYPAVIISAMIGIGILMLVLVVPKLAATFVELGIKLPITTRIVIGIGLFLSKFWYLLPLLIVFLLFFFREILKIRHGKKIIDKFLLKIPVISDLIKKTNSAYTARILSSLIAAGVPIVKSLEITSGVLKNIYYKEAILQAAEKVGKGKKISEILNSYQNIYPLFVIQMIAIGEETGETSGILSKVADSFEDEISNLTKNLASIIEPVLILLIGGAVGFFAFSMIQPMYTMLGAIQ